jgi:hypothetical protein
MPVSVGALVLVTAPGAAVYGEDDEEEIHACRNRSGEIVYQSEPCPEQPGRAELPAATRGEPEAAPVPAPSRTREAGSLPATQPGRHPARPASPPPKPRVIYRPPASAPRLVEGGPSGDHDRPGPRPAAGPVDPRFASPERTWQTFGAALREGDREAARSCIAPAALASLGPRIDSPGSEGLAGLADASARVKAEGDVGPYWSLRISRSHERPRWVFFVRTESGEWKIAAI